MPGRGYPTNGVDVVPGRGYPRRGVDIILVFWENNVHARAWTSTPGGGYPRGGVDIHAQEFFITD